MKKTYSELMARIAEEEDKIKNYDLELEELAKTDCVELKKMMDYPLNSNCGPTSDLYFPSLTYYSMAYSNILADKSLAEAKIRRLKKQITKLEKNSNMQKQPGDE